MAKEERFEKAYSQSTMMGAIEIWIDKETGINYLFRHDGYAGGLTVLLDENGKPAISETSEY